MAAGDDTHLLAHFDGPAPRERNDAALPVRGAGWVLKWAGALTVLLAGAGVLANFGYGLAAERALLRAARAGALEATLPRASVESVAATIRRRLNALAVDEVRFTLTHNDAPVGRTLRAGAGDRLAVTLDISSESIVPRWLRMLAVGNDESRIVVRAEKEIPRRALAR